MTRCCYGQLIILTVWKRTHRDLAKQEQAVRIEITMQGRSDAVTCAFQSLGQIPFWGAQNHESFSEYPGPDRQSVSGASRVVCAVNMHLC